MQPTTHREQPVQFWPGETAVFRPHQAAGTWEWCKRHLPIVKGPLAGGRWDPDYTPHAKGIMDAWDMPTVREVFFIAGSQVANKTTIAHGCIFAALDRRPTSAAVSMPDMAATRKVFNNRLVPQARTSGAIRRRLAADKNATQGTHILFRDGSCIDGLWRGSEMAMSGESYEILGVDEEDADEARVVHTVLERVLSYPNTYKIFRYSKIRGIEGEGTIWDDMNKRCQVINGYMAVCPACGAEQSMCFERIRVPEGVRDPRRIREQKLATYECEHCGWLWSDNVRNKALALGRWRPDRRVARPTAVGFRLRSWESRHVSLSTVMADFFEAQGDPDKLKLWNNHHAAKPHKTVVTTATVDHLVRLVDMGVQPLKVPAFCQAVTLSVDMQAREFVYDIWAHSCDTPHSGDVSSWVIDYGTVGPWEDLTELALHSQYGVDGSDRRMGIWRAALDTGGGRNEDEDATRTQQAYAWLQRMLPHGFIFGTKGMSRKTPGVNLRRSFIEKYPDGRTMKRGLQLMLLNGDYYKRLLLLGRLHADPAEGAHVRFHRGMVEAEGYFKQLLAENLVRNKQGREVWTPVRRDNHHLDTSCGHLAMIDLQWAPSLLSLVAVQAAEQQAQAAADQAPEGRQDERKKETRLW